MTTIIDEPNSKIRNILTTKGFLFYFKTNISFTVDQKNEDYFEWTTPMDLSQDFNLVYIKWDVLRKYIIKNYVPIEDYYEIFIE